MATSWRTRCKLPGQPLTRGASPGGAEGSAALAPPAGQVRWPMPGSAPSVPGSRAIEGLHSQIIIEPRCQPTRERSGSAEVSRSA